MIDDIDICGVVCHVVRLCDYIYIIIFLLNVHRFSKKVRGVHYPQNVKCYKVLIL